MAVTSPHTRRLSEEEKCYIRKYAKINRINYYFGIYSLALSNIALLSYVSYDDGLWGEEGVLVLACILGCLLCIYKIDELGGGSKGRQIKESTRVEPLAGTIELRRKLNIYKHYINDVELRVPGHWETYLSEGDLVEADVCFTPNENYLLGTSSGLSIQLERKSGLTAPFSHHPTSYFLLMLGMISACGVLAGVMFNLGWTGDPELERPSTFTGFFDGPLELSFLFAALLLVPPTLWYIYRHFQDVAKIREMYKEEFGLEP